MPGASHSNWVHNELMYSHRTTVRLLKWILLDSWIGCQFLFRYPCIASRFVEQAIEIAIFQSEFLSQASLFTVVGYNKHMHSIHIHVGFECNGSEIEGDVAAATTAVAMFSWLFCNLCVFSLSIVRIHALLFSLLLCRLDSVWAPPQAYRLYHHLRPTARTSQRYDQVRV